MSLLIVSSCSSIKKVLKIEGVKPAKNPLMVRWAKNLDPSYSTGNLPIGLGAPLIHEDIVFMGSSDGVMTAYSLDRGRVLWEVDEGRALGAKGTFYKDHLIYGSLDGRVYSRHYLSHKLNYAIDLGSSVEDAPTIYKGRAIFHLRNHKLVCLDAETGKILWAYKRSVPYNTTIQRVSAPMVLNGTIYVGFADGVLAAFNLDDGLMLWETALSRGTKFVDVDTSPVMVGGLIWASPLTGPLSMVDPKTGVVKRTLSYRPSRKPIAYGDFVFIGTLDGDLVKLSKSTTAEISSIKVTKRAITSIITWKSKVAAATTDGLIHLIDPQTMKIEKTFSLGSAFSTIFGDMSSSDNYLAAYSARNRLYIFNNNQAF